MAVSVVEAGNACRRPHKASVKEDGKQRRPVEARMWRAGGVNQNGGMYEEMQTRTWEAPYSVSFPVGEETRSEAEYPHRESLRYGVADQT